MPSFSFEPEPLDTNQKLFELVLEMMDRGWDGSIGIANEHEGEGAERILKVELTASADVSPDGDLDAPNNIRRINATLGDIKVPVPTITVMSPELYHAMYGAS